MSEKVSRFKMLVGWKKDMFFVTKENLITDIYYDREDCLAEVQAKNDHAEKFWSGIALLEGKQNETHTT